MYPDLSYVMHDLFGTEPDNFFSIAKTFGIFLALAVIVAAWFLSIELKRKEREGLLKPIIQDRTIGLGPKPLDVFLNALLGFVLLFKIVYVMNNFDAFKWDAAEVLLSGKGNWIAGLIGAILWGGFYYYQKLKLKLPEPKVISERIWPHHRVTDIAVLAALSGVFGSKVFAIFDDWESFLQDPLGTFFSGSGMAIYGGLIVAFAVVYFYVKKKGITPIHLMDAVAPALIISYGVGRLGCHFSGDGDWGIVNELAKPDWMAILPDCLWAMEYPNNVLNEGVPIEGCKWRYCHKLSPAVFPTPIYEFIMTLIITGILWTLRTRIKIPGMLFFIYMIFNGMERFWIEKIRVNDRYDLFGISSTQAELISVLVFLGGLIGCIYLWQKSKKIDV